MKLNTTYLIILVTAFSFVGLSSVQSISYFTVFFGDQKLVIDYSSQEEENETSNNEEVKEFKEKIDHRKISESLFALKADQLLYFQESNVFFPKEYLEVITPPPERELLL